MRRTEEQQELVDEFRENFDQRKQELTNVLDFLINDKELKLSKGTEFGIPIEYFRGVIFHH